MEQISAAREFDREIYANLLRISKTMLHSFQKTNDMAWLDKMDYYISESVRVSARIHSFDYKHEDALIERVMLKLNQKI